MNKSTRDRLGGALLVAAGGATVFAGIGYGPGTLRHMGSGFYPTALGVLLAFIGIVLFATATRASASQLASVPAETTHLAGPAVQWRGWLCILGGTLAFVVLGQHGGLVPASFASVFVAALGDRRNSVRDAAALAALMTLLGVAIFHYGLHVLLPLFQW
jgi:hypothetical protein